MRDSDGCADPIRPGQCPGGAGSPRRQSTLAAAGLREPPHPGPRPAVVAGRLAPRLSSSADGGAAPRTGLSRAAGVHAQLRIDILERRLTPGERFKPAELAKRLGVSVNVMREALALLAAHNLVRVERNRGFYVTALSPETRTDLTAARKLNEGAALRLAVERGGADWQSEILAAHHRMASQPMHRPDDPATRTSDWTAAHRAFHHTLIEAADNHVLLEICQRLSDAAQLYRAWSGRDETGRDVPAEYKALLDAALARQAQRAVAVFEAHIE